MLKDRVNPIRVVIIDDIASARDLLLAILQNAEGITVVGTGTNGEEAVRLTKRLRPDVITMDVVMPTMDGLEATRHIMRECPTRIIIVTASLMRAGEDLTFKALRAGALTVLRKPGLADPETCEKLVHTVRLMAEVPVVHHWGRTSKSSPKRPVTLPPKQIPNDREITMVGIAASTGGPSALASVLAPLPADFPVPILAVQHITQGYATGLAEWLNGETALQVALAEHGTRPQAGTVTIAPDDYHLQINRQGRIELSKEQAYRGLRPSANNLFKSLAASYGPQAIGIVLTGMGDDGADGLENLHNAGGITIAQDQESCVVYGMPHEAMLRNAVDQVLNPVQIATMLTKLVLYKGEDGSNDK